MCQCDEYTALDMPRVDPVYVFLLLTGCVKSKMMYFTYAEFGITLFYLVTTYLTIIGTENYLSVKLFSYLCLLIESIVLLFIAFRLYHQRQFREMHQYSKHLKLPDDYLLTIGTVAKYHVIGSNLFVFFPVIYAVSSSTVRYGDVYTYPFLDVVPIRAKNVTTYLIKYVVYAVTVYIAHIEFCFINVTFIHSVGVLKRNSENIVKNIQDAIAKNDERKMKNAIVRHQEFLK